MGKTKKYFRYSGGLPAGRQGKLPLPVFFPDATRGFVKSIDTSDIEGSKTNGLLVNTLHLYRELGIEKIQKFGGMKKFMNFNGAMISDSGGFQVGSLIKADSQHGKVTDLGATFHHKGKSITLTPELSIQFQMSLGVDMVVVLDDFTSPIANHKEAEVSVVRTIDWAARSKAEFVKICKKKGLTDKTRPYILGVVQGGKFQDLRKQCSQALVKIGFDGFGYGGWPIDEKGKFDYESARTISENAPDDYFLYGLGIGKPEDVIGCSKLGFNIFDCVLPTRDARHGRLYVYNFSSIKEIDVNAPNFYSYLSPDKQINLNDNSPVSLACDCLTCTRYTRGYLGHLFKMKDSTAGRLATIHNLRFYSILMERLRNK